MNLSIKNVPDVLVEQLRGRAKRNHRSLQGEMLAILERAVGDIDRNASGSRQHATVQSASTAAGLRDAHQAFIHAEGASSRADDERAQLHDRAAARAIELMRRGLAFGGRRFTRDEMHER